MTKAAMLVLATAVVAGCGERSGSGGPLGVAGASLTAPITAPIMFFEATRSGLSIARFALARRNTVPQTRGERQ